MISVVIETENASEQNAIRVEQAIEALRAQTVPIEQCEVLFMIREAEAEGIPLLKRLLPSARVEVLPGPVGYGQMKMYGALRASHPVVAFLDTDCIPQPDWLEQVRRAFREAPEDVMLLQGRTVFLDNPGADFFTFYLFGLPWLSEGDRYRWLVLNNFAARKEAFIRYPFADLPLRKGVEYLMITKLLDDGKKIRVVPQMRVTHNYQWGISAWFNRGRSDAFDFVTTLREVKSLVTSPEVIRWRSKLPRLCLAYSQWLFGSLKAALEQRKRLEMKRVHVATCVGSALVLWMGGMTGFISWRLGGARPESPF